MKKVYDIQHGWHYEDDEGNIVREPLPVRSESAGWVCECGRKMVQPQSTAERIVCHHCGIEISKPNASGDSSPKQPKEIK